MIKSLILKNFQKHAEFSADFQPGLNLIVGPNWSGKSTLQRAILFALFGSSAVPISVAQLIKSGERLASVTLVFDHYQVTRSTNSAILIDLTSDPMGEVLASGQTSVTAQIESILGITAKNFLAFHVARQKEAGSLLGLGSAKLAAHINAVTGVDLVDQVLGRLKDETTKLTWQVTDLDKLVSDLEQAEREGAGLRATWSVKMPELEASRSGYGSLDLLVKLSRDRYMTAAEQAQQCAAARAQRAAYAEQERECRAALDGLVEPAAVSEEQVEWARKRLSSEHAAAQAYRQWILDREAARESLEQAKDRLVGLESVVIEPVDVASLEADWAALSPQVGALKERAMGLQKSLESAVCHACHRPMEGVDRAQIEADLQAVSAEWPRKQAELQTAWEQLEKARLHHRTWESHQRELETFMGLVKSSQERLDALLASPPRAPETDEQLQERQAEIDELYRGRSVYLHWQITESHLVETLNRLKDQISQLPLAEGPSEDEVAALKDRYLKDLADLENTKTALHQLEMEVAGLTQDLRAAEDKLAGLQAEFEKKKAAKTRLAGVTKLTKYLRDNRDRFSAEVWQQLLSFAGQFISNATSGKVTGLVRTGDGDFRFVEDGEERDIELASGLQEDILGVGLKLALGAALGGPVDFMLFDEVSAAGEDENALLLTSLLKEAGQQVILISHRTADCAVADWVVEV